MNRIQGLALAAALISGSALASETQILVPEGDAGSILRLTSSGEPLGRIENVAAVHGLAAAPVHGWLVAGSLEEADTAAMEKPRGVSAADHAAHHGGGPAAAGSGSLVTFLDARTGEDYRRIEVPGIVHHVAVDPAEHIAAVTHPSLGSVSLIDLERLEVRATIETGPQPNYAAFDASGRSLYVSNAGNDTVSKINIEREIVERNILLQGGPKHLVLDQASGRLFVAEAIGGTVAEIDLASDSVVGRYEIGGLLHGIDLAADARSLFVSARERGMVSTIDLSTGEVSDMPLAPEPYHLTTIGEQIYVSSAAEPRVWILRASDREVVSAVATRDIAHQIVTLE